MSVLNCHKNNSAMQKILIVNRPQFFNFHIFFFQVKYDLDTFHPSVQGVAKIAAK